MMDHIVQSCPLMLALYNYILLIIMQLRDQSN